MSEQAEIGSVSTLASAFSQMVNFLEAWTADGQPYCWFRGSRDSTHALQPGAYWRSGYSELPPLIDFVQDAVAFTDVGNLDSWDTYYLAQHHSIPTRLLDWTTSFGAALFFALDGWDGKTTPCIWVLRPDLMNKEFFGWEGIITPENNEAPKMWLPRALTKGKSTKHGDKDSVIFDNQWPLAIYPKKSNRRVIAQQGAFTVHGMESSGLPDLVRRVGGDPSKVFARLKLESLDPEGARNQLALLGLRRSAIYPDIDNYVRELKEEHGW